MIINQSMPDELWKQLVEENPTNPWRGAIEKLKKFTGLKHTERVILFRAEQQARLEKLYGKPIEDLDQFLNWLEGLKSLNTADGTTITLKEGQIKQIKGSADHYKEAFPARAKKMIEDALDRHLGNY